MEYYPILTFFIYLALFRFSAASDRTLSFSINEGCPLPQCINGSIILIHVKASGDNDTLHHIWDFSGKPSVMLAVTESNAVLQVNWTDYAFGAPNSVKIIPAPTYTYSVILDKILEFNDESDTGTMDNTNNASYVTTLDMKNFNWKVKHEQNDSGSVMYIIEANGYSDNLIKKNGTVQIMMSAFAGADHNDMLPRLLHTGNASQIEITLNNLSTQYASSRYGLHLIAVSEDNVNATVKVEGRQTLDDEHAPDCGDALPGALGQDTLGGYLQWRPVVYTSPERDLTTESFQYKADNLNNSVETLNLTLLYSMYGFRLSEMLVVETNVTFGVAGDGFYRKTNYAVWTFLAGYGHPPVEKFSMLVVLVLSIGLGLPALLIIMGAACIFIRRLSRNKDDLFLSR